MKNITFPEFKEEEVSIHQIDSDTRGIILCYNSDNKLDGYINYYNNEWSYNTGIDCEMYIINNDDLSKLIEQIRNPYKITQFKLLEFEA